MAENMVVEVKKKKEFSKLPDSIVERALALSKNNVKQARAFLRKYFGVFLTNKVLKPKNLEDYESVLKSHISSKKRDYALLYGKIAELCGNEFSSVLDLGSGANGFSYRFLEDTFGKVKYIGIESSGQVVENTNVFFKKQGIKEGKCLCEDLFDLEKLETIFSETTSPRLVFLFQTIDALENLEKDFSKKLLLKLNSLMNTKDVIVISNSLKSISGKSSLKPVRYWLESFLGQNFQVIDSFEMFEEKFLVIRKK